MLISFFAQADPQPQQAPDHSVTVKATSYQAVIQPDGKLIVNMKDVPVLEQHFPPQTTTPVAINIISGSTVSVRAGTPRVEYTFGDDTISIATDGFPFDMHAVGPFKVAIVPGGLGGAFEGQTYGGVQALALDDGTCVAMSIPFLLRGKPAPWLSPTCYINGSGKKPGDTIEFVLTFGQPAVAVDLLSGITVKPTGDDLSPLTADGNKTTALTHFAQTDGAAFVSTQTNLNKTPFPLSYSMHIEDHYVNGNVVLDQKEDVALAPGEIHDVTWKLPKLAPGFYYADVTATADDKKLTETKFPFTVDLVHYDHPLTTPPDFQQFWTDQMTRLKDAEATHGDPDKVISTPDNPNKAITGTYTIPGGRQIAWYLIIPEKADPGVVSILPTRTDMTKRLLDKIAQPGWVPDAPTMMTFFFQLPDDSTFTRWTSKEDNNMLDSIFANVEAIDFFVQRPEAKGRKLIIGGGSRMGPLGLITAALRRDKVAACLVGVATSCGMSWQDKPYEGWGMPQGLKVQDASALAAWIATNAYFDPINHAPNVTCPIIFSYGLSDTLAPAPGIEVMFHHAGSAWKHISRHGGGHFDGPQYADLNKEMDALLSAAPVKEDESTLKEH